MAMPDSRHRDRGPTTSIAVNPLRPLRLVVWMMLGACACSKSEPPTPSPSPTLETPAKDPTTARQLIASGAVVLDVRTPDEYAEDHLAAAVNIPVQELSTRLDEVAELVGHDKARPVVVYCAAGARAAKAKKQLEVAGYSHIVNGGGIDDLR